MSSPLAIAAVTAALKDLLNDGLLNHDLSSVGSFTVSALPPDRIATGNTEPNQLNLFLYQVTSNQGWRNEGLPTRNPAGQLVGGPKLALDLHYLLTAYGSQDMNAEILLGYAMLLMHETPVLTRAALRNVLAPVDPVDGSLLPTQFGNLSAIDLADQVELVKITPNYLSSEELTKMWTAMQARYRPSIAYTASVVLIEGQSSGQVAPPVLSRGAQDRGPGASASPPPALTGARAAASDLLPAVRLGDDVLLTGSQLGGSATLAAVLTDLTTGTDHILAPATPHGQQQLRVTIPSLAQDPTAMAGWSVGGYMAHVLVSRPGEITWPTNAVPLVLAPLITLAQNAFAAGDFTLRLTCAPRLTSAQLTQVTLLFGMSLVAPSLTNNPADPSLPTSLQFNLTAIPAGVYLVRLRVQGIDSLPVTLTGSPVRLEFDPAQKVTVV